MTMALNIRDQLALLYRGERTEFFHNNVLVQAYFSTTGVFEITVADPETKETVTTFETTSLKEAVEQLTRF